MKTQFEVTDLQKLIAGLKGEIKKLKIELKTKADVEGQLKMALGSQDYESIEEAKKIEKAKWILARMKGTTEEEAQRFIEYWCKKGEQECAELAELIIEGEKYLNMETNLKLLHKIRKEEKRKNRPKFMSRSVEVSLDE